MRKIYVVIHAFNPKCNYFEKNDLNCTKCSTKLIFHIYNCNYFNEGNPPNIEYKNICNGNLKNQIKVFEKFQENWEKRENLKEKSKKETKENTPCDPDVDPLYNLYSNV